MNAQPYLCLGGTEVANALRTLSYLRRGLGGGGYDINVTGPATASTGYSDVYSDIYHDDVSYAASLGCYCAVLDDPSNFRSPELDPAPWYEPAYPASGDFLGVVLDTLTITNPPIRSVTQTLPQGAAIGPLTLRHRVISAHGIMYAASPAGMAWGERWLTDVLSGGLCDDCTPDVAEILPACPSDGFGYDSGYGDDDPADAFRTLRQVGIVDGPLPVPITDIASCQAQEVSWQLVAGNPYLHHPTEQLLDSAIIIGGVTPASVTASTSPWGGDAAVRVNVEALSDLAGLEIRATPMLDGQTCPDDVGNACVRYVIPFLPAGHAIKIDATDRVVAEWSPTTESYSPGYGLLEFDGGFSWIEIPPCSTMCVAVEAQAGAASVTIELERREL